MSAQQYIIPDLLANWPWQRVSNSMLDEIRDEANEWVMSLGLFEPRAVQKIQSLRLQYGRIICARVRDLTFSHLRSAGIIYWSAGEQRFVKYN